MAYDHSDSSGTADDLLPSHQTRSVRGGQVAGNGRPIIRGLSYSRVQDDMESQIHQLEQEAYIAVLRAFKAQSDVITWEKESLITDLRRELRVLDDEHRELLSRANSDEIVQQIREWRQLGGLQYGFHSNAQTNHDIMPSPTISGSRKRQKTSQSIPLLPLGVPTSSLHPKSIGVPLQTPSSAARRGASGIRGKKPKMRKSFPGIYAPTGSMGRGQATNRSVNYAVANALSVDAAQYDPLIGRKVMTRWPDDNNFYEAIIRDYDAAKGLHLLSYDINTPNESWEWVNLEEISPEDIRWEGEGLNNNHRGSRASSGGRTFRKSSGRGRGILKDQPSEVYVPSQNGTKRKNTDEIEILNTDTLIKEVEKLFEEAHPDPLEIEKAKKVLKEHEQSLLDAIARLEDLSDGESEGGGPSSHGQSADRSQKQQFNGDKAEDGGKEQSNGEQVNGEG
ncbi:hypothetical protein HPP92_002592 [Vanilla planifolia]|uniref:ENT domain-containing protein n=1 Tax=Vanilla planifolia TaxID=51239 RepID=A0A835S1H0_VANPL|nr:hypothetical protein HPP92_002592 [Vanilla planifolia]